MKRLFYTFLLVLFLLPGCGLFGDNDNNNSGVGDGGGGDGGETSMVDPRLTPQRFT